MRARPKRQMGRKPPWRVFLRAPEVPDQREIAEIEPVLVKNPKFCSKSGLLNGDKQIAGKCITLPLVYVSKPKFPA